jgi:hypothetical protein
MTGVDTDKHGVTSAEPDPDGSGDGGADVGLEVAGEVAGEVLGDLAHDQASDVAAEVIEDSGGGPMVLEYAPLCVVAAGTDDGPCLMADLLDFGEVSLGSVGTAHLEVVNAGTVGAWLLTVAHSYESFSFVATPSDGSYVVPLPAQLHLGGRLRITVSSPEDLPLGAFPEGEITLVLEFDSGNKQMSTLGWTGIVVEAPVAE